VTTFKLLREIVTFRGGGTPSKQVPEYWNGNIPWASVKDFTSTSLSETQDFISQEGLVNSSANLIPKGHVIIPTRMSLGKAAINSVDLAINQDLRALVPKLPLDTQFLLHAVLSLKDEIVKKGSGATVKGITQEELYKLEIAFPPLDDQKRIAHLLGKVEGLIARRKHHLQQLDDLLKSVFLEMFGDPVRNMKGWAAEPLGQLATIERGRFSPRPRNDPKFYNGAYPFIQTGDISRSNGRLREYTQTLNKLGTKVSKEFDVGTIVIAIVGATIGETAILQIPTYAPDSVIGITPKTGAKETESVFIEFLLRFWKPVLRARAPEAARANINIETLRPLPIIWPLKNDREKFAAIVEKVESLKSRYQHSLTDLETLYGALSQKAFKGELGLSRVPLSVEEFEQAIIEDVKTKIETDIEENHQRAPLSELVALTFVEGRKALLDQLLPTWLDQLGDTPFSAQHFMAHVEQRAADLIDAQDSAARFIEQEDVQFGPVEYDHLKTRVFESIEQGRLTQGYDDANNRVQVIAAKG
jgi:type I restriction enzyme S subunit